MKLLKRYQPSPNDTWIWQYATHTDVLDMFQMAKCYFEHEMASVVTISDETYKYSLDLAVTHQRHNLAHEQLLVCRDKDTNKLLAYCWIGRGHKTPYSPDEMAEARMLHMDLDLPAQTRIHLLVQALAYWEIWATACHIPVIVSTSIRTQQQAFLKVHERMGYVIRGGIAYKQLAKESHV